MEEVDIEKLCRAVHEVQRVYSEQLGDYSYLRWESSPQWHKDSIRDSVLAVIANANWRPEDLHQHWLDEKARDGWSAGPRKSIERREHPFLIPYGDLPAEQRAKSAIFLSVVNGMVRRRAATP